MKTCDVDGCEKGGKLTRGWCSTHYSRWRKHGDPLAGGTHYATPEEAFLARTEPLVGEPGCIIWTGGTNSKGYGHLSVNGRGVSAHRYAWERERGAIPAGMHVDHTCYVRSCVNVDHLRLASHAENGRNRSGANKGRELPRGVTRHRDGRRYQAEVGHNGTRHYLGMFDTPEAASIAAQNKRALLYGEFAGRA